MLKPTDEESQECAAAECDLPDGQGGAERYLKTSTSSWSLWCRTPDFTIPENEDNTVELTRAPFEHELAGQRTRPYKDEEMDLQFRAAKHLLR